MRAIYSSFSSAMHQLFFPPWFQFMALEKDANRLSPYRRRQLPLDHFLGNKAHTPPRRPWWRGTANHGNDSLALDRVQSALLSGSWFLVQCRFQTHFFVTPGDRSNRLCGHAHIGGHLRCLLAIPELAQNQSPSQHSRRFLPFAQHLGYLPPILLPNWTCTRW